MSVETSNAPRETWTINFADDGTLAGEFPIGDQQAARQFADEGSAFFGQACVATRYVRADLVVPTVGELVAELLRNRLYGTSREHLESAAESIHALLLSRIEGDNDGQ